MKHLLNNLSDEEKNSIREQHTGGMKVVNERFNEMVNKVLGDAKPYLSEQQLDDTPRAVRIPPRAGRDETGNYTSPFPDNRSEEIRTPKKPNPGRITLPIADEFCDILCGKAQLKKGAKGDLVRIFQEALVKCSKQTLDKSFIDSDFGDNTRNAVRDFQRRNGLTVDGGIGKETSGKMCELGCLPKDLCSSCPCSGGVPGKQVGPIMGDIPKDGNVNVECEKVQACISDFMKGLQDDFCVDEDKVRGLLKCVGLGNCFEEGLQNKIDVGRSKKTIDV